MRVVIVVAWWRSSRLSAWVAVVEAARTLCNLLLLDCHDVDWDAVELWGLLAIDLGSHVLWLCALTPSDLRRSLVSWSTSSWPLSLFWVKSRADTSGTY